MSNNQRVLTPNFFYFQNLKKMFDNREVFDIWVITLYIIEIYQKDAKSKENVR